MFSGKTYQKTVYLSFSCYFPCLGQNHWSLPAVQGDRTQQVPVTSAQNGIWALKLETPTQWKQHLTTLPTLSYKPTGFPGPKILIALRSSSGTGQSSLRHYWQRDRERWQKECKILILGMFLSVSLGLRRWTGIVELALLGWLGVILFIWSGVQLADGT